MDDQLINTVKDILSRNATTKDVDTESFIKKTIELIEKHGLVTLVDSDQKLA